MRNAQETHRQNRALKEASTVKAAEESSSLKHVQHDRECKNTSKVQSVEISLPRQASRTVIMEDANNQINKKIAELIEKSNSSHDSAVAENASRGLLKNSESVASFASISPKKLELNLVTFDQFLIEDSQVKTGRNDSIAVNHLLSHQHSQRRATKPNIMKNMKKSKEPEFRLHTESSEIVPIS